MPESVPPSFSNIEFFETRMRGHSKVVGLQEPSPQYYVVHRDGMSPIKVFLTNSYVVGLAEYFEVRERHPEVDAIVTIGPYNSVAKAAYEQGLDDRVGVFQFKEFMGALHKEEDDFAFYKPPHAR